MPEGCVYLKAPDGTLVPITRTGPAGAEGPRGPQGIQGPVGPGLTVSGSAPWADIILNSDPQLGEMWLLSTETGAPASPSGPAAIGDGIVWDGGQWMNIGPIRGPKGDPGPQGDPGPVGPGVTSSVRYLWGGTTTTADPGAGRIAVSGTGNQPRVIAISETDADAIVRNIGLLNLADSIVITDDVQNTTQFSRYMLTADPVDHGAYWTMAAIRTDTIGPTQPPSLGTPLRVQAYLTDVPPMTLDNLGDVSAPPLTPVGKVLGTTATGQWGPVDPPAGSGGGPNPATTNPVSVSGQSSSVGTSLDYARADHRHTIQFAAPVALGPAISAGTSTALARADHVHPVPALDALPDVAAPADTPAGKVLGTTAVGVWGPVDPPAGGGGGLTQAQADARYLQLTGGVVTVPVRDSMYGHEVVLSVSGEEGAIFGTNTPDGTEQTALVFLPRSGMGDGSLMVLASPYPVQLQAPDGTLSNDLVSKGYVDSHDPVVQHLFTDDVQIQVWDDGLGRLQKVWYDSGWRDIGTLVDGNFTATGTGLFLMMRRTAFQVNLAFRVAVASSTAPRHTFLPLLTAPTGFVPFGQGVFGQCLIGTGASAADAVTRNASASIGTVSNFQALGQIDISAPGVSTPYAPGDVVSGIVIYQTGKVMPASLPGSLQHPAPE